MTIAPRGVRTPEYFIKLPQYMSFLFCGKYSWRHRVNYGYLFRNLLNYQSFLKIVESWKSEIVEGFEGFLKFLYFYFYLKFHKVFFFRLYKNIAVYIVIKNGL